MTTGMGRRLNQSQVSEVLVVALDLLMTLRDPKRLQEEIEKLVAIRDQAIEYAEHEERLRESSQIREEARNVLEQANALLKHRTDEWDRKDGELVERCRGVELREQGLAEREDGLRKREKAFDERMLRAEFELKSRLDEFGKKELLLEQTKARLRAQQEALKQKMERIAQVVGEDDGR
jgi:hypothetical protein